jgi:NAD(P)-dependent dehydrogenase (short-subunit alcohol dehydrogenase family)
MLVIDFSEMESVKQAAREAMDRFPEINGLVLSVGILIQNGPNFTSEGHELMFATNVMGPFLFTQMLIGKLQASKALVLHVIAPFYKKIHWDDLESIRDHRSMAAFNRTKTLNRIMAAELARQYQGKLASVAFDPAYVIDKTDPELNKRWPSGFMGFLWRIMTLLFAKLPKTAGEPIADLMLSDRDRNELNGSLFRLYKEVKQSDKVMQDESMGSRLWNALVDLTNLHFLVP